MLVKLVNRMNYIRLARVGARRFTTSCHPPQFQQFQLPAVHLDTAFYLNPANTAAIRRNIADRNSDADIDKVIKMHADQFSEAAVLAELKRVPNMSHPDVENLKEPSVVHQKV